MALTLALPSVRAAALAPVRCSVGSGARPAANVSFVSITGTQLLSRLDALRTKTENLDLALHAASLHVSHTHCPTPITEGYNSCHFGESRARLQHWWKEHLEDKAALVHAACRDFSEAAAAEGEEEKDGAVHLHAPVSCARYPPQASHEELALECALYY